MGIQNATVDELKRREKALANLRTAYDYMIDIPDDHLSEIDIMIKKLIDEHPELMPLETNREWLRRSVCNYLANYPCEAQNTMEFVEFIRKLDKCRSYVGVRVIFDNVIEQKTASEELIRLVTELRQKYRIALKLRA